MAVSHNNQTTQAVSFLLSRLWPRRPGVETRRHRLSSIARPELAPQRRFMPSPWPPKTGDR
eukprot:14778579-Alexandrium_andersonii.AAC.1